MIILQETNSFSIFVAWSTRALVARRPTPPIGCPSGGPSTLLGVLLVAAVNFTKFFTIIILADV